MAKKKIKDLKGLKLVPELHTIYEKLEGFIKAGKREGDDARATRYGFARSVANMRLMLLQNQNSYPLKTLVKQGSSAERYLINRYPEYKAFLKESFQQQPEHP